MILRYQTSYRKMSLYLCIEYNDKFRQMMKDHIATRRQTDSGCDIMVMDDQFFDCAKSSTFNVISLGIRCAAFTEDGAPAPCMLIPRSSIVKTPFRLANNIGLIDMGYRGGVVAVVDIIPNGIANYKLEQGTRLFQIVQHNWMPWKKIIIVDKPEDLPPAIDNRGEGGFGSTGR